MLSLAVIGSGSGSNFKSIVDAIRDGRLDARVVCVVSDIPDACILERARTVGVPAIHVDCAPYRTKLEGAAEDRVLEVLRDHGADSVALAGFMRIVKPGLIGAYRNRMLNIHPSLLPAFPGLHAWKQALVYGMRITGCTVHFVDEGTDTGPIILQRAVEVREDDTPETLHARIQVEEHAAYPEALRLLSAGRLRVAGRIVRILPPETAAT